jgi:hypothetical protein
LLSDEQRKVLRTSRVRGASLGKATLPSAKKLLAYGE